MVIFCVYTLNITKNTSNKEYKVVRLNVDCCILFPKILSKNTNFKYIKCYILI